MQGVRYPHCNEIIVESKQFTRYSVIGGRRDSSYALTTLRGANIHRALDNHFLPSTWKETLFMLSNVITSLRMSRERSDWATVLWKQRKKRGTILLCLQLQHYDVAVNEQATHRSSAILKVESLSYSKFNQSNKFLHPNIPYLTKIERRNCKLV